MKIMIYTLITVCTIYKYFKFYIKTNIIINFYLIFIFIKDIRNEFIFKKNFILIIYNE